MWWHARLVSQAVLLESTHGGEECRGSAGVLDHLGFDSYPITVKWQPVVNRVYVRQALDAIDELGRMIEDDE